MPQEERRPFIAYAVLGKVEPPWMRVEGFLTIVFAVDKQEAIAILLGDLAGNLAGKTVLLTEAEPFSKFLKDEQQTERLIAALKTK